MTEWSSAERVLAVRLDTLGDVLMTTPAIRALKHAGPPGRTVTLLTSSPGSLLREYLPDVDEVIAYDAPWMKAEPAGRQTLAGDLLTVERLRGGRFDAAVLFTVFSQSPLPAALLCHLAGIPLRLAHCRENPYRLLTDWVPETEPESQVRHEVQRQLDLVGAVGASSLPAPLVMAVPPEAIVRAMQLLERAGLDLDEPWIVVHPGATAPSRRYPPDSFTAVVRELAEDGLRLVITGDAEEQALAEVMAEQAGGRAVSIAGQTSLQVLAGVISGARLLLANNTGPVHVAAALDVPVVDLYALTNPQHTPWMVPSRVLSHEVPCRWCYKSVCPMGHHLCLRGVRPAEVVTAVHELLSGAA